jgi:hypothetical protein
MGAADAEDMAAVMNTAFAASAEESSITPTFAADIVGHEKPRSPMGFTRVARS